MKRKSKIINFLLSFIPGMSHIYLGQITSGVIFLILFAGLLVGPIGLASLTGSGSFMGISLVGIPVLWLSGLIDSSQIIRGINQGYDQEDLDRIGFQFNKKLITLMLSVVPGAGHMYLGYTEIGAFYMGIFFLSIFLMGWLGLSFLLFLVPLIWFYSFFDAFHIVDGDEPRKVLELLPKIENKHLGLILIFLGLVTFLEKTLYPGLRDILVRYIDYSEIYRIKDMIQGLILAGIFIYGGVRILRGHEDGE